MKRKSATNARLMRRRARLENRKRRTRGTLNPAFTKQSGAQQMAGIAALAARLTTKG